MDAIMATILETKAVDPGLTMKGRGPPRVQNFECHQFSEEAMPNKLEYKTDSTTRYYYGLRQFFFFFVISVRISILLSKTVSYRSGTGIESEIESGTRVLTLDPGCIRPATT